jgi:alkanesulfonate monooxygenase SsuD/methylene tetrahydromethanopterin reductase-like flavin-dependent oxidoreductase (luciferase family)
MKFGLSLTCARPAGDSRSSVDIYREVIETAELADQLGFHTVVVTEHHFVESGWCPAPLAVATAIAARTQHVRVGTGILIVPLFDPVRLAEEVAVLDTISNGRAVLGVGMGYRKEEFAGYGISFDDRSARWQEALEILPSLLSGESVSHSGEHFHFEDAVIRPAPVQRPHPPIWIGTTGEQGIRRAARRGHSIYLGNAAPKAMLERRVGWFLDEREKVGTTTELDLPLMREMHVAPTREQAYEEAGASVEHTYKRDLIGLGWSVPIVDASGAEGKTDDPNHPALALDVLTEERCVLGSPEDCIAQIEDYERIGATELLFRVHHPHLGQDAVLRSLRLFADEVIPRFAERLSVPL